jgi:hypothetical protein
MGACHPSVGAAGSVVLAGMLQKYRRASVTGTDLGRCPSHQVAGSIHAAFFERGDSSMSQQAVFLVGAIDIKDV